MEFNNKAISISASPAAIFLKMEEESNMNRYLNEETLPKQISALNACFLEQSHMATKTITEEHLAEITDQINELTKSSVQLAEQKHKSLHSNDVNLSLFRQQALVLTQKKEGALLKLNSLNQTLVELRDQSGFDIEKDASLMPQGDDLKDYISSMRAQSIIYKSKQSELASLEVERVTLKTRLDILGLKQLDAAKKMEDYEQKNGVLGFNECKDNLEIVSEKKGAVDQEKGKTLQEISDIIQTLSSRINVLYF